MTPDFLFGVTPGDITYDIETFPNIFNIGLEHTITGRKWYFEISFRRNDLEALCQFIDICNRQGCRWVGFNNIGFDYPVVHMIYKSRMAMITAADIYTKAMSIINCDFNARFSHMVYESDWYIDQLDLYKVHHFDNQARATSLKVLEFNMRMDSIEDLPFDVGLSLNDEQADILKAYMWHDIKATTDFYRESLDQIKFREELSVKYDRNFMNHNDTKIGKDYFIMELEKHTPGCCYKHIDGKKHIQQTPRESIDLGEVILPYIRFDHPEFQRVMCWFQSKVITETKGAIQDVNCTIDGFQFDFGTGGIHGATSPGIFHSDDDFAIVSVDVASMYPNIAIANKLAPEHLGETFCRIYEELYQQRVSIKKQMKVAKASGDMDIYRTLDNEQAMLKLALNGVYGDSNSQYSPFYDPKFTMSITINGQLLLCMLAEKLMQAPDSKLLLVNTDGLEIKIRREHVEWMHSVCRWWEGVTGLILEDDYYKQLCIRDCNNYIGVFEE